MFFALKYKGDDCRASYCELPTFNPRHELHPRINISSSTFLSLFGKFTLFLYFCSYWGFFGIFLPLSIYFIIPELFQITLLHRKSISQFLIKVCLYFLLVSCFLRIFWFLIPWKKIPSHFLALFPFFPEIFDLQIDFRRWK